MSNIAIRRQNDDKPLTTASGPTVWDPWRTMRSLLAWDPFREMSAFPAFEERVAAFNPAFDIKETKDGYHFKADLPGIQDKDLEVTVTGNRLTVSGKRDEEKEEKGERYYTYERSSGSFSRSFTMPDGTDCEHLQASLDKGVLSIVVPKKPEVQPKKIAVKTEQTPKS
jgi:HSP20 family protein